MSEPLRPGGFSVKRSEHGGAIVLSLSGELDVAGVEELRTAAEDIPAGAGVMVDLAGLQFIDSSGLRALMNLDLRSRAEGWSLAFTRPQPDVARLLKLCGFADRVAIAGTGE